MNTKRDCLYRHSAILSYPPSFFNILEYRFSKYLGTLCEPQYSDSASHQLKHPTFMSSVAQPCSQSSSKIPLGKIVLSTAAVNASNALCCLLQVTPSSISLCRPNSSALLDLCVCLCLIASGLSLSVSLHLSLSLSLHLSLSLPLTNWHRGLIWSLGIYRASASTVSPANKWACPPSECHS